VVTTIDASTLSFNINTFGNFFLQPFWGGNGMPAPGPATVGIDTTSATTFTNFTADTFAGVAVKDLISAQGWLFMAPAQPQICTASQGCPINTIMAAEAVVDRPGPSGLF
jgi:hypothetical protein